MNNQKTIEWIEKSRTFNQNMKMAGLSDSQLVAVSSFSACDIAHTTENPLKTYAVLIALLEGAREDEERTCDD